MDESHEKLQKDNPSEEEVNDSNRIVIDLGKDSGDPDGSEFHALMSESLRKSMESIQNSYLRSMAPLLKQQTILDSIKLPMLETQAKISSMVAPMLEQQKLLSAIANPLKDIKTDIAFRSMELISPAIQSYYQNISLSLAESIRPIIDSYKPLMSDTITSLVSSYQFDLASRIELPIHHLLETIDFSPLYSIFEQLKGFDFSKYRSKLNKIVIAETYDAKWFPHALCLDDRDMVADFWDIIESTRKSKNRIKRIDRLVYSRYDKNRIEGMKKAWRQKSISSHKLRMMNQAVQAYHRKEYAITVVMLSTLWEGIIYDKANDLRGKSGKRTKEDFSKLISQTDYDELFASFFDEYIMYDCRSVADVIEDVPGRNSSAHSWYSKYPSRKAGLNAILFTDFLINLEPLEEVENG